MDAQTTGGKLIFHAIISTILLLSFIAILRAGSGLFFMMQLVFLMVGIILLLAGLITAPRTEKSLFFFFLYLLFIGDFIYVALVQGSFYIVLTILSIIGFFASIPQKISRKEKAPQEPHSIVFDENPKENTSAPADQEVRRKVSRAKIPAKETSVSSTVKHIPGKYVGSSNSNIYHEPKCDWAKRIAKSRRIWFKKKEDAWEKGYKSHNCVQ